ncbi:MAG: hypothetical protein AAFY65_13775 [Pseudomonadota bacterium]
MIRLALLLIGLAAPAMAQQSNAARYLLGQEVANACNGAAGRISPGSLIERDLTGDGRDDLIIAHEGIRCSGGGSARSLECGMQVCTTKIWVRQGDLLVEKAFFLGGGIAVAGGNPPAITGYAHGGKTWSMRWNGRSFAR